MDNTIAIIFYNKSYSTVLGINQQTSSIAMAT